MPLKVLSLFCLALVLPMSVAQAQQRPATDSAERSLRPSARAYTAPGDTSLAFPTRPAGRGRQDVEEGVMRAAYRVSMRVAETGSPEEAARAYMRQAAAQFGWPADTRDLELTSVQTTPYSSHLTFQQTLNGVPVYNRQVKVSLDAQRQPVIVLSGYALHVNEAASFDPVPAVDTVSVRRLAAGLFTEGAETNTPEQVIYPAEEPLLAWRVVAWPHEAGSEWEVLLDARTGETIQLINLAAHVGRDRERGGEGERGAEIEQQEQLGNMLSAFRSPSPAVSLPPTPILPHSHTPALATGTGLVFDPDPVSTAGTSYGGAYTDQNDADVPLLNEQRKTVVLQDITFRDGLYRLEGPYVRIVGDPAVGGASYTPPAEASPDGFQYTRANDHFEAVMAYYHIDASRRYAESLDGVYHPVVLDTLEVNPHGHGSADNSQYLPSRHAIGFGDGGIDDAEDAQVIWHEYAHALLESSAPGFIVQGGEGLALHEGWADYWAASYVRDKYDRGELSDGDWRNLFRWDGNNGAWCGRTLDHPGHYPDEVAYPPPSGCSVPELYQQGLLWATTLMEIYTAVGRTVSDRLNLASHAYLSVPVTFRDAAEALIQADQDLYGGAHASILTDILGGRGFVDTETPEEPGLQLVFYPNPFATVTRIDYNLPEDAHVRIDVYDVVGRRKATVVDQDQAAGPQTVEFDGSQLSSGTYFLRLRAGSEQVAEPMIIIR
jgi:zinc metalloprotease ZmpB